jgi:hypothetical protein
MADRVLPIGRLMFLCDSAVIDLGDLTWELKNPWLEITLPPGVRFPFRHESVWVYAQLTDGLGSFDVRVEMRQLMDNGGRRTIGAGTSTRMVFHADRRLFALATAFEIVRVPFRESGLYEFFLTVDEGEQLEGQTAVIRVFSAEDGL